MPGCLGLDAMWLLIGYYLVWIGGIGWGRALGVGEVKFEDQVLPTNKLVTYRVDMKRVINRKLVMGLGDATMDVDGRTIYQPPTPARRTLYFHRGLLKCMLSNVAD